MTKLYDSEAAIKRGQWRWRHAKEQRFICPRCGKHMKRSRKEHHPDEMTLDHIVPLARGGPDTYENTQTMCYACNFAKADRVHGENYGARRRKQKRAFKPNLARRLRRREERRTKK